MAHLRVVSAARTSQASFRDLLYKSDHPRRIDDYIDFFGDGALRRDMTSGCCGDVLLGSLA